MTRVTIMMSTNHGDTLVRETENPEDLLDSLRACTFEDIEAGFDAYFMKQLEPFMPECSFEVFDMRMRKSVFNDKPSKWYTLSDTAIDDMDVLMGVLDCMIRGGYIKPGCHLTFARSDEK